MRIENAIDTIMLSVIELKEVVQTAKLGPWINGPYRVTQTHVNGMLTKYKKSNPKQIIILLTFPAM
jgi:hypothetical protein